MRWAGPRRLIGRTPMLGVYWDNPDVTAPEQCRTDACLVVPDGTKVDAPVALCLGSEGPLCLGSEGPTTASDSVS